MSRFNSEQGFALLVSVIVLALLCLIGFYLAVTAATEIRVSDNYEGEVQARSAASAGLDHARAALRGLEFDDLLQGPDGTYDNSPDSMDQARTFAFRNPLPWSVARTLDILDPSAGLSTPDDGILNTGHYLSMPGTTLIPATGITLGGSGTVRARYFVKVTDNNGEASEREKDPLDNPFIDGDGLILVRSVGIARASRESAGSALYNNSIVIYEARVQRRSPFDLQAPLTIQGVAIQPLSAQMFEGRSFVVQGGSEHPGVATIDVDRSDESLPSGQVAAQILPLQESCFQGQGSLPSILDLTPAVESDRNRLLLLNKDYVWDFAHRRVRKFADSSYRGDQDWTYGNAPDLGSFNPALPMKAPGQRPKVTVVEGDLAVGGGANGGGLLVVTGRFSIRGPFTYIGLVLVAGTGELDVFDTSWTFAGGIYVARVAGSAGALNWGRAGLAMKGNGALVFDPAAIRMAIALIPPDQVGFREITSSLDP